MAEKILNTRIQLKYDTLANWTASTFKLKAGELAIVTLGEVKDGSAAKAGQHPVLFKVGTGEHTFAELPFASALAADVYAWAKASDVILEGKTIKFVGTNKEITLNYVTETEVNTLISNALKSYSTTEEMNAAIKVEADRAKGVEGGLDTRIQSLETAVGENGSVAAQIKTAIEGLDSDASQEAGADGLALGVTLVDGKVTSISGSIAANTYDAYGAAATAEGRAAADATSKANAAQAAAEAKVTALADGAVKDNADAIAAINNSESGILAQAKDYADGLDSAMDGRMVLVEAAKHTHDNKALLDTYTQTEANLADAVAKKHEHANKAVLDGISADKVAAWDAAEQNAKDYADDLKDAILGGEGLKETFDTLLEIQNWIEGDGVNATELTEAIAAEAKLRKDADDGLQSQINALGVKDGKVAAAEKADEASRLDATGVEQVKGIKVDNATNADKAADADKLGGVVASNYALKTDAQGYADQALIDAKAYADQAELDAVATAKSYTDGRETAIKTAYEAYADQAELDAIDSAKDYTDEREVEIKKYADQAEADAIASAKAYTDGREVEIKKYADQAEADAKAYADGLAGNYATAAQGAKADSALQSIEAGTGLKVSAKADNKQTIDIDESVVFVFDCGSATKLID